MSLYISMTISHAFIPDQLLLLIDASFLLTYSNTFICIIYQVLLLQKPFIFLKGDIASLLYFLYAEFTFKLPETLNFLEVNFIVSPQHTHILAILYMKICRFLWLYMGIFKILLICKHLQSSQYLSIYKAFVINFLM